MFTNPIFNENEQNVVYKNMRNTFINTDTKIKIFKYINEPHRNDNLKVSLCEALFRNIVLELYGMFIDDSYKTIPDTIFQVIENRIKANNPIKYTGGIYFEKTFTIEYLQSLVDDREICLSKLRHYRHKVLAHKSFKPFDYKMESTSIDDVFETVRCILSKLLELIDPQTTHILHSPICDIQIQSMFQILAK